MAKEHKHQDQEAEDLQYMQSEQQINLDMILPAFTSTLSVVYPTAPKVNIDTLTTMDTATDGKTYVLTDLDVKLPTRPQRDTMRVKLDMGAEANILPVRTYNKMFPNRVLEDGTPDPKYLQPTHIEFECNKDSIIRSLGCINLDIAAPGKKLINSQFFVSSHHNQILIGHPSCDRLGAYTLHMQNKAPPFDQNKLLPQLSEVNQTGATEGRIRSVADLMKRYPKQFDVIGQFEGEYHMVTDPNVPPSQHAMCKIPIEYQEKIEKELDRMEEQGIITKVTEPTEWVNSITYPVKPNGDLRICLDPKDLNKAIIREHYKAPTLEEITHKLCGATKILQSGLLQRILCLPYGQSIQYEDNIQHNTQKRKIQIPQSSHGCQIQPRCIPDENGSNSRGTTRCHRHT